MKRGRKATKVVIYDFLQEMKTTKKYTKDEIYQSIKDSHPFLGKETKTKARKIINDAIKELNWRKLAPEERDFRRAINELEDAEDKRKFNRKFNMEFHEVNKDIGFAFGGESRIIGYYRKPNTDLNENAWYKKVVVKIATKYDGKSPVPHFVEMSEAELSQIL